MSSVLVSKVYGEAPTFSVELWPPRSEKSQQRLEIALDALRSIGPDFVSITYGAGGSTRDRTHALVVELADQGWTIPMAHLTCAAHSKDELESILRTYQASGVTDILALRGDPPLDSVASLPKGELTYASELVSLSKSIGNFGVAVAAHPEGHPASLSQRSDRLYFKRKLELADFAITQFYFSHDVFSSFREDMDRLGVEKPIIPGVMAPTSWATLRKMSSLTGTTVPASLAELFDSCEDNPEEMRKIGVEIAVDLCTKALEEGVPGVHIYSMNSAKSTHEIYDAIRSFFS